MIKNAEFDDDFESFEKVAKNLMKKVSTKSDRKIDFFTFITVCKIFQPITYGVNFLAFFQRISYSASNFALNDIHIEFLQQTFSLLKVALFANSKAKL
jgi:hypothetical protein